MKQKRTQVHMKSLYPVYGHAWSATECTRACCHTFSGERVREVRVVAFNVPCIAMQASKCTQLHEA